MGVPFSECFPSVCGKGGNSYKTVQVDVERDRRRWYLQGHQKQSGILFCPFRNGNEGCAGKRAKNSISTSAVLDEYAYLASSIALCFYCAMGDVQWMTASRGANLQCLSSGSEYPHILLFSSGALPFLPFFPVISYRMMVTVPSLTFFGLTTVSAGAYPRAAQPYTL